jgi:alkanesulfonate monooxygenase SsuD/methylene tetrahydromethanopterin reductase-like flavin-dependent oxidoreductase (luciferase family)
MKDGTANAGLQDQRASFEWLQRHVAKFGGDPDKITISVGLVCLKIYQDALTWFVATGRELRWRFRC